MYCIECGTRMQNSAKFCPQCGTKQIVEDHFEATDLETKKIEKKNIELHLSIEEKARLYEKDLIQNLGQSEILGTSTNHNLDLARKEKEAMYFGLIVTGVWLFIVLSIKGDLIDLNSSRRGLMIASGIVRLISVLWIMGIATRLDRNKLSWSLLALFFPGLALIIIGNLTTRKK